MSEERRDVVVPFDEHMKDFTGSTCGVWIPKHAVREVDAFGTEDSPYPVLVVDMTEREAARLYQNLYNVLIQKRLLP